MMLGDLIKDARETLRVIREMAEAWKEAGEAHKNMCERTFGGVPYPMPYPVPTAPCPDPYPLPSPDNGGAIWYADPRGTQVYDGTTIGHVPTGTTTVGG